MPFFSSNGEIAWTVACANKIPNCQTVTPHNTHHAHTNTYIRAHTQINLHHLHSQILPYTTIIIPQTLSSPWFASATTLSDSSIFSPSSSPSRSWWAESGSASTAAPSAIGGWISRWSQSVFSCWSFHSPASSARAVAWHGSSGSTCSWCSCSSLFSSPSPSLPSLSPTRALVRSSLTEATRSIGSGITPIGCRKGWTTLKRGTGSRVACSLGKSVLNSTKSS